MIYTIEIIIIIIIVIIITIIKIKVYVWNLLLMLTINFKVYPALQKCIKVCKCFINGNDYIDRYIHRLMPLDGHYSRQTWFILYSHEEALK